MKEFLLLIFFFFFKESPGCGINEAPKVPPKGEELPWCNCDSKTPKKIKSKDERNKREIEGHHLPLKNKIFSEPIVGIDEPSKLKRSPYHIVDCREPYPRDVLCVPENSTLKTRQTVEFYNENHKSIGRLSSCKKQVKLAMNCDKPARDPANFFTYKDHRVAFYSCEAHYDPKC